MQHMRICNLNGEKVVLYYTLPANGSGSTLIKVHTTESSIPEKALEGLKKIMNWGNMSSERLHNHLKEGLWLNLQQFGTLFANQSCIMKYKIDL